MACMDGVGKCRTDLCSLPGTTAAPESLKAKEHSHDRQGHWPPGPFRGSPERQHHNTADNEDVTPVLLQTSSCGRLH